VVDASLDLLVFARSPMSAKPLPGREVTGKWLC
jgi:hypothetical protein